MCETPFEYASFGCRADCGELAEVQNLTMLQIDLYYDFDHPTTSIASSVCCFYTPYLLLASVPFSHMPLGMLLRLLLALWSLHCDCGTCIRSMLHYWCATDRQYTLLAPGAKQDMNHTQAFASHLACPADANGSSCVESVSRVWCRFWFSLLLCR